MPEASSAESRVVLDNQRILGVIQQLEQNAEKCISTIKQSAYAFEDVAVSLQRENKSDKVANVRASLKRLLTGEKVLEAHVRVVSSLRTSYECTTTATDFRSKLAGQEPSAGVDSDERLTHFDQTIWKVDHPDEQFPGDEQGDEELVMTTQQEFLNQRCPYTQVSIHEMTEPVEDQVGYIYEKAVIMSMIQKNHAGQVVAPFSGTNHIVNAAGLKPCYRLVHQQKRRKVQSQAGAGASSAAQDSINLDEDDE